MRLLCLSAAPGLLSPGLAFGTLPGFCLDRVLSLLFQLYFSFSAKRLASASSRASCMGPFASVW